MLVEVFVEVVVAGGVVVEVVEVVMMSVVAMNRRHYNNHLHHWQVTSSMVAVDIAAVVSVVDVTEPTEVATGYLSFRHLRIPNPPAVH